MPLPHHIMTDETLEKGHLNTLSPEERSRLIGDVITLMTQSDQYGEYRINVLPTVIFPALQLNQFRIYHNEEGAPVGYVSWAHFSEEAEKRFLATDGITTPEDWHSGDITYFMDFIAPFGHAAKISKDLKKLFKGKEAKAFRFDEDELENSKIDVFKGDAA